MFKKKKKRSRKIKSIFKTYGKKKPGTPVRIKKRDDYAVLEPIDLSKPKKFAIKQNPQKPKKLMLIKKERPKPVIKPKEKLKEVTKPVEVKPKLIVKKTQQKEIKPVKPVSEIPTNHIETDIDRVMKLIEEKEVVGLDYLSKTLKISVDRLEAWAKMLEDRELIEIEYPIIGLPKLRKKKWKKES